jgi:hypothetical protein
LKILLAAKHPPGGKLAIGGVQSWTAAISAQLRALGHEITVWGPEWPLAGRYDAGVLANIGSTQAATAACERVLRVSHGIIPAEAGGDAFTSEEVRDYWKGSGPIIRQPIDLDFWRPSVAPKQYLCRFSYRRRLDYLPSLAKSMGLEYIHVHKDAPEAVRKVLQRSAIVVATGRAACEAMACGAPVVIADDRVYQGPLLDPDPIGAMTRNYSGRGGFVPGPAEMKAAIQAAMQRESLRGHVEQHHDARKITEELLCSLS